MARSRKEGPHPSLPPLRTAVPDVVGQQVAPRHGQQHGIAPPRSSAASSPGSRGGFAASTHSTTTALARDRIRLTCSRNAAVISCDGLSAASRATSGDLAASWSRQSARQRGHYPQFLIWLICRSRFLSFQYPPAEDLRPILTPPPLCPLCPLCPPPAAAGSRGVGLLVAPLDDGGASCAREKSRDSG